MKQTVCNVLKDFNVGNIKVHMSLNGLRSSNFHIEYFLLVVFRAFPGDLLGLINSTRYMFGKETTDKETTILQDIICILIKLDK